MGSNAQINSENKSPNDPVVQKRPAQKPVSESSEEASSRELHVPAPTLVNEESVQSVVEDSDHGSDSRLTNGRKPRTDSPQTRPEGRKRNNSNPVKQREDNTQCLRSDKYHVNIGFEKVPIWVDKGKFERAAELPTAHRFILSAMDLVFTSQEMAESRVGGGRVKNRGKEYYKKELCKTKVKAILNQAATRYNRSLEDLISDTALRGTMNSKCRKKRFHMV